MTVNELIAQLEDYKRDFGGYIGDLPVKLAGWPPDRWIESVALCESDEDDEDHGVGAFDHVQIVA